MGNRNRYPSQRRVEDDPGGAELRAAIAGLPPHLQDHSAEPVDPLRNLSRDLGDLRKRVRDQQAMLDALAGQFRDLRAAVAKLETLAVLDCFGGVAR